MRAFGLFLFLVTLGLCAVRLAGAAAPAALVVIVNADNPSAGVSRKFLSDAFLKKSTRWTHGELIRPVDQPPDSAIRRAFSEDILKRSVAAVRSYWQQLIFAGRDVPPPEVASDELVVDFVSKHAGAVGYVSGATKLGATRALSVVE
jgi:ABC-type phosphate transport system substrate-binding protein